MIDKAPNYIRFSDLSARERVEALKTIDHLFIARKDVYGEQWVKQNGKQAYTKKEEEITDELLIAHLTGKKTIGIYQFAPENENVKWAVLDIDGEHITNAKNKINELWQRLVDYGIASEEILIEESGSMDSFHIWIFFEEQTNAKKAEEFLKWIIKPIDPLIEVFPKQRQVHEDKFGNLVKLPFGFHKAAKVWSTCFLQTEEGEGVTGVAALKKIRACRLPALPKLKTNGLRPCFCHAIEEQWRLTGGAGDNFRVALAAEMHNNGYRDAEMHEVFALQPGYKFDITQKKIDESRRNDYKTWQCQTIKDRCSNLLGDQCKTCDKRQKSPEDKQKSKVGKPKEKAKKPEAPLSLADVLALPDATTDGEICNVIRLKKTINGLQHDFFVKAVLVEGNINFELTEHHDFSPQTAPSIDFYEKKYNSLADLYEELYSSVTEYVAFGEDSVSPTLIALGCMASYFREVFFSYPYFDFISSEPEAGKTTALKVQTFTSFYGTIASSISEPLLFREIDGSHCFYGLDNIERLFASPKDYAGIIDWLLSSYARDIPCKRLEPFGDGYRVRYFDGYGIKAFSHIRDFPFALRALRSRCIQIVMQAEKPVKFYPSPRKFTAIRDKLYKARLDEFEAVKESYTDCIEKKVLTGRTGDLYLPLLSIAKLIDKKIYDRILKYAKTDEVERKELDSWNKVLIGVLLNNELIGSRSATEINPFFQDSLKAEGLLKDEKRLDTRTVTARLKKLGFSREDKKTGHKTWFIIDRQNLMIKAHDYDIIDGKELQKYLSAYTPTKSTLFHLSTFETEEHKAHKGSIGSGKGDKPSTEELESGVDSGTGKVEKVPKLPKRGVCTITNVCGNCGEDSGTTEYNGEWFCDNCLSKIADELNLNSNIRPEAFDDAFQKKQAQEAANRLRGSVQ